jgi:hypothetical protein
MIGADMSLLEAEFYYDEADGDIELALQLCLTPSGEEARKAPGAMPAATETKLSRDAAPMHALEEDRFRNVSLSRDAAPMHAPEEEAGLGAWLSSWFGGKKPAAVELQMMGGGRGQAQGLA